MSGSVTIKQTAIMYNKQKYCQNACGYHNQKYCLGVTHSKELTGIPHLIGLLRSIIIKTTTVECQNQKYCQEGPQSRTYGVPQTKLHPHPESHNQMNCNEV